VGFPDAVQTLAKKAGIDIQLTEQDDKAAKQAEILYRTNKIAAGFFEECLYSTKAGARALSYMEGRGYTLEVLKKFRVGYAPNRWDGLVLKAKKERMPLSHLLEAGLVSKSRKNDSVYDRFRGRIMFPICTPSGRVVGFGGRIIEDKPGTPKYLNSPETIVYRKSRLLYGLFQSKEGIRKHDRVVVVEGYTDVMRMHQHGLDNVVASSGTAFTKEQAAILRRYTHMVTLLFDGDSAGLKAALRGADILIKADLDVSIATLPAGSDPDSFLIRESAESLKKHLGNAKTFFDFYFDRMEKQGRLETPKQKSSAISAILDKFAPLVNYQERMLLIKDISEKMGVDEKPYFRKYAHSVPKGDPSGHVDPQHHSRTITAEEGLLQCLLFGSSLLRRKIFTLLPSGRIESEAVRSIVGTIQSVYKNRPDFTVEEIIDKLAEKKGEASLVTGLAGNSDTMPDIADQYALDCLLTLNDVRRKKDTEKIRQEILQIQAQSRPVDDLLRKFSDLKTQVRNERDRLIADWDGFKE